MTIRSDFLGDCEQFSGLPEAINDGQFLIPRMNREELQTSITGPIDFVKGKISPQLVHKLLNEVGTSPDQLPLLQHVLMRTWEVWEEENTPNKPIDIETYNKTGGMIKALSNHAEEAFAELNLNEEKKLAEFIFKTITLKGADNRGIRRPTSIMKIVNITSSSVEDVVKIINIFRRLERGFLMPPESIELKENSVIDISHESLMRVWERLGTWVNEEAESAEIYTRICESALLYDKNMAGLWRDPDLQIAVEWRQKNNPNVFWAKQYNSHYELAMRFIDASIQDKKFVLAEKNRRRYLTQIVISIFLIALSSLTIWAYVERNRSSRNEKLALSEKMKAELQEAFANEQKKKAEENALKAVLEKENADKATLTAFEQRKIAITNAKEAEIQKLNAEKALLTADDARKAAEIDKRIAIAQKQLSDSLKTIAFESEKNAYRLRVLSIASNLAIKSTEAKPGTYDENIKPLLALQANKFNNEFKGKSFNPELFTALFSSMRYYQNKSEYSHNFHSDYVRSVCYSSDGKTIYSVSYDGKLIACESKNLQASPRIFAPQAALLENIQFNKAQNKIMASADKTILIYDLESVTEKPKAILEHSDKITAIAWMDNYIISSSIDFKIRIFDQKIRKPIKNYALPSKPLCMSVNEGKHLLVVGCENGKVYLMKTTEKGEFLEPEELSKISAANVTSIDLNVKGNKVACGTSDGNIFIFETQNPNNKPITIRAHNSAIITSVKFSPTANQVASSAYDSYVKLWNIELPDEQPIIFKEHESWALTLAFSPDGNELVSGGRDKTVRIYSIQNHKMVDYIESKVSRNFTLTEWTNFIGNDIPYEKTISLK
jgi:WD40 repeat protein